MNRNYKWTYLFIIIFALCKPEIDKSNYPLTFSLVNSTKKTTTTAFSLSYSQISFSFPLNVAITPISPTASATISSCLVTPSLPQGLTIDNTCTISGTPISEIPLTGFTVTASSSSFTAITTIQIEVVSAPSALGYGGPYIFTVGSGITTITPTVTGTVSSYSISPVLPSGLNFNTTTGEISGTPSTLNTVTSYTVTASNAAGNTMYSFTITVADVPLSGFSYSGSPFTFTANQTISTTTPTITGNIVNCSSTPTLPAGLILSGTTCQITGTPTIFQSGTSYTILASNSGGSITTTINITVLANLIKKIFVTNSGFTPGVQFNSPIGADTLCNSDAGKPTGGGTYKAMIVAAPVRVACVTSNCSGGLTEHIDWIFQPNTTYYQIDGVTVIAITDANGLMPAVFTNSMNPVNSKYWTGMNSDWTTGLNNCVNWTTSGATTNCGGYNPNNTSGLFTAGWVGETCGIAQQLLCVQQ